MTSLDIIVVDPKNPRARPMKPTRTYRMAEVLGSTVVLYIAKAGYNNWHAVELDADILDNFTFPKSQCSVHKHRKGNCSVNEYQYILEQETSAVEPESKPDGTPPTLSPPPPGRGLAGGPSNMG